MLKKVSSHLDGRVDHKNVEVFALFCRWKSCFSPHKSLRVEIMGMFTKAVQSFL
jgi:hypothetical protein